MIKKKVENGWMMMERIKWMWEERRRKRREKEEGGKGCKMLEG